MAFHWYVVQAYSGYEKKVKAQMEEKIELEGLDEYFKDILVPTEEVVEMKAGQKRKSQRKFFPGYVLINMDIEGEGAAQLVRGIPRVTGFIGGTTEKPAPISKVEADRILNALNVDEDQPKPRTTFEVGQVVRVLDGPFIDFTGVVENINYQKSRLQVAVTIFGRSTPVELEFSQVIKDE
jgi:transcriptional antiterminator NusG